MNTDLIIIGGTIVDGTGGEPFRGDVTIRNGRITEIGTFPKREGVPTLDASGLVVAPGFIDIHSHSDFTLLMDPRAQSSVAQGVTTELIGNCGHGCAPVIDVESVKGNIYGYSPQLPITWSSMAEYLRTLESVRPAVNVLTLVPNGMLCRAVVGLKERSPDQAGDAAEKQRIHHHKHQHCWD